MPKDVSGKKYVFFIGGSGARVCSAFLHSCAAGAIREDEVRIMLLDADTNNAACTDCTRQYALYQKQYALFRQIPRTRQKKNASASAFHCDVKMYHGKAVSPVEVNTSRLRLVVPGNHTNGRRVLGWFYDTDEQEQDLLNGFYAHPNIGCIFFQNFGSGEQNPQQTNELFLPCLKDVVNDLQNDDVQIAIVGSLFGGTGAAGIPTVQAVIEAYCKANAPQHLDRLHFGGVLLTPYFKVPPQSPDQTSSNIPIDSDTFLSTTQAALFYYQFKDQFEKVYLVGKEELDLTCTTYRDGGVGQRNKAHVVELMAAIAAEDFLSCGRVRQDALNKVAVLSIQPMKSAEDMQNRLEWGSDCVGRNFWPLADMLRTQILLEAEIYPYVERKKRGAPGTYQWYKAYGMGDYNLGKDNDDLNQMRCYSEDYLEWMFELQYRYTNADGRLDRDPQVALCGEVISEVIDVIRKRTGSDSGKADLEDILSKFNTVVEFARNMGYVGDKAFKLLSALGIVPQSIAALGLVGLFKQLYDLTAKRRKR